MKHTRLLRSTGLYDCRKDHTMIIAAQLNYTEDTVYINEADITAIVVSSTCVAVYLKSGINFSIHPDYASHLTTIWPALKYVEQRVP